LADAAPPLRSDTIFAPTVVTHREENISLFDTQSGAEFDSESSILQKEGEISVIFAIQ
jgi:hypothetical protein